MKIMPTKNGDFRGKRAELNVYDDAVLMKGCQYCTEYEDLPEHIINGKLIGRVFDTCIQCDENGWHLEVPSGTDIGIQYCPYCGRKLEEE